MALAIKMQEMVDRGEVRDFADLARLGFVSRARLTQIMNLLLLAPDIQANLLDLAIVANSRSVTERELRKLSTLLLWPEQRQLWREIRASL